MEKARIVQPSTLMKVVAATLLNQPNRSARDYRGISSEYQDKLFQDDHDVRLYYAACYLNYRLDYLWRNQRLDTALKIYRYYFLAAVGKKTIQASDVFNIKKSSIDEIATRIVKFSDSEDAIRNVFSAVHSILDKQVRSLGSTTRERMRDAIRSESFAKTFDTELASTTLPIPDKH